MSTHSRKTGRRKASLPPEERRSLTSTSMDIQSRPSSSTSPSLKIETYLTSSPPVKLRPREHRWKEDDSESFMSSSPKKKKKKQKRKLNDTPSGDPEHASRTEKRQKQHNDNEDLSRKKKKKSKRQKISNSPLHTGHSPVPPMERNEIISTVKDETRALDTKQDLGNISVNRGQGIQQVKVYETIETLEDDPFFTGDDRNKGNRHPHIFGTFASEKPEPGQFSFSKGKKPEGEYQRINDGPKFDVKADKHLTASNSSQSTREDISRHDCCHNDIALSDSIHGAKQKYTLVKGRDHVLVAPDEHKARNMAPPNRTDASQRPDRIEHRWDSRANPDRSRAEGPRPYMKVNQFNNSRPHLESRVVVRPPSNCSCKRLPRYFTFFKRRIPKLQTWQGDEHEFYYHVQQIASCCGHPKEVTEACSRILREQGVYWTPELHADVTWAQGYLSAPGVKERVRVREQSSIAPNSFYGGWAEAGPSMPPPPLPKLRNPKSSKCPNIGKAPVKPLDAPSLNTMDVASPKHSVSSSSTSPTSPARPDIQPKLLDTIEVIDLEATTPSSEAGRNQSLSITPPSPSVFRTRHQTVPPRLHTKRKLFGTETMRPTQLPISSARTLASLPIQATSPRRKMEMIMETARKNNEKSLARMEQLLKTTSLSSPSNEFSDGAIARRTVETLLPTPPPSAERTASPTSNSSAMLAPVINPTPTMQAAASLVGHGNTVLATATAAPTSSQSASPPATNTPNTNHSTVAAIIAAYGPLPKAWSRMSIPEKKVVLPPLEPIIPISGPASDEEIIQIGKMTNHYERHRAAPYAYHWSGRLSAKYKSLHVKHGKNGLSAWTAEDVQRVTHGSS